jgi:peptidyl-prolyl cis-trans isomerase SurA
MKKIVLCLSLFGSLSAMSASAQKVVADKIVGIVGDKIILKSDIDATVDQAHRQDLLTAHPEYGDPCYQMQIALTTKALVLQAEKDSIPVSDEDVENQLDLRIRNFIQMYGGKDVLEQVAQQTVYQIKDNFRPAIRENLMADAMRKKVVQDVTVTPTEVRDYYDKIPKDSLQYFESKMEVGQIVIVPNSNLELDSYLRDQLNGYKSEVESGKRSFELLAKLYSDDPGSKDHGGILQLNRGDKNIDAIFLNAAFRLKEGQVSPVIKAKDGYDIIQMVARSGDDATVRYILKAPQVTDAELNAAKSRLDSIRAKLIAGTLVFGQAVALYSQDDNTKEYGGLLTSPNDGSTSFTYDAMDKEMVDAIKGLKAGEYSQPMVFTDRLKKEVRILYLKSRTEPHRENLTDDYNFEADQALAEKKNQVFQKWLAKKIPSYYIMLDPDYTRCTSLKVWADHASTADKILVNADEQPAAPAPDTKKAAKH